MCFETAYGANPAVCLPRLKLMTTLKYVEVKNTRYDVDVDFSILNEPASWPNMRGSGRKKALMHARRVCNKYLGLRGSPSNLEILDLLGLYCSKKKSGYMIILAAELIRKELPGRYIRGWSKKRKHIFTRDNNTCAYCRVICDSPHCDHIHPWSLGGSDDIKNLVTSCAPCNIKKRDRLLTAFELNKVMDFIRNNELCLKTTQPELTGNTLD